MKNNNLPLLISVVVLVFLMVLVGISSSLTLHSTREEAFRVEANKILASSKKALKKVEILQNEENCKIDDNRYCFTVGNLIDNKLYAGDSDKYIGKVIYDKKNNSYELYLKKNDEFKIISGSSTDYTKSGILAIEEWKENYRICECD